MKEDLTAEFVQRSCELYKQTIKLNIYENHLSLITDFDFYCKVFKCDRCELLFCRKHSNFLRHTRTCESGVKNLYPGGIYKSKSTVFEKLQEAGVCVSDNDRHFSYYAVFDFESYFIKEEIRYSSERLVFEARHKPLSVAISSNIPGYTEAVCFITQREDDDLVRKMLEYLENLSNSCSQKLREKFAFVFETRFENECDRSEKLSKEFDKYLRELVVLGLNNSSHDINLIKKPLIKQLLQKIEFTIKKTNSYLCMKTEKLRFLDEKNFLAPGDSYRKF